MEGAFSGGSDDALELRFRGEIWSWRGPAPYHFITVPDEASADIRAIASLVTYGWGVIPVTVALGGTQWTTSLFPKDGRYLVPIKAAVRAAERLSDGDTVALRLTIRIRPR